MAAERVGLEAETGAARIGIRELRNDVARVVRRAAAGERIVVTVDGQPVAMLGPLVPSASGVTVDDLLAAGLLLPPGRSDPPEPPEADTLPIDARTSRVLNELRGG